MRYGINILGLFFRLVCLFIYFYYYSICWLFGGLVVEGLRAERQKNYNENGTLQEIGIVINNSYYDY